MLLPQSKRLTFHAAVDNLSRLGLIEADYASYIAEEGAYDHIKEDPFTKKVEEVYIYSSEDFSLDIKKVTFLFRCLARISQKLALSKL